MWAFIGSPGIEVEIKQLLKGVFIVIDDYKHLGFQWGYDGDMDTWWGVWDRDDGDIEWE